MDILIVVLDMVLNGLLEEVADRLIRNNLRPWLLLGHLLKLFETIKLLGCFDLVLFYKVLFWWQHIHLGLVSFVIHISFDLCQFTQILLINSTNFMGGTT